MANAGETISGIHETVDGDSVIDFDKAFGSLFDIDLGEQIPDPLDMLNLDERRELTQSLIEVERAQEIGRRAAMG